MQPSALGPQLCPIVVFASGRGSNFAALLAAQRRGALPVRIGALLSDRPRAPVLDIARAADVPAIAISPRDFSTRAEFDGAMAARAAEFSPGLIVLAGYMRVIDAGVIRHWHGCAINLHPSLLPKHPGLHTHQRVLDAGDAVHGASVHFVTPELDGGPVISQVLLPVRADDDAATLAARLLPLEHRLLVATVALLAQGRVVLGGDGIALDGGLLHAPLKLAPDDTLVRA